MEFKKGQIVICDIDVYNDGRMSEFDGTIIDVNGDNITVNYLEGYKDRVDIIKAENIVALVDETEMCEFYRTKCFSGHLIPNDLYR